MEATESILSDLQKRVARNELQDVAALITALRDAIVEILAPCAQPLVVDESRSPYVILVVGVNGSGKTTTIGKLARRLTDADYSVMLAAGDTFRAAAIEQLNVWAERTGSEFASQQAGADPGAVVFDALQSAKSRRTDILLADTAGRLHSQSHLMEELKKVKRVIQRVDPTAPHEVLLVLDANQGQNALSQAIQFNEAVGVTGLVLTKLDGTAKGWHRGRHCAAPEAADSIHWHRRAGRGLRRVRCARLCNRTGGRSEAVIVFDRVNKRYPNGREALSNCTFEVHTGEMVFLTGRSGAGKSTVLKLIACLERPTRGTVVVGGKNTSTLKARHVPAFRRHIGVVFQDHKLLADRPVFDNVALPLVVAGVPFKDMDKRVRAALDQVGLLGKERFSPMELSVGEQQRVGIARAVVSKPPLLIADEPTGNLDPDLALEIMKLFRRFSGCRRHGGGGDT